MSDTLQALQQMLEYARRPDCGVLTAGEIHPDIPTIHDVGCHPGQRVQTLDEVRHLGFGFFQARVPGGKIDFDAGGAMRRCNGFSWTPLRTDGQVDLPQIGYCPDRVIKALEELIEAAFKIADDIDGAKER